MWMPRQKHANWENGNHAARHATSSKREEPKAMLGHTGMVSPRGYRQQKKNQQAQTEKTTWHRIVHTDSSLGLMIIMIS